MRQKDHFIRMEELPVVMMARGFSREQTLKAVETVLNLRYNVGDVFKLNALSIRVPLKRITGKWDTLSILHPKNKFFNDNGKYGIALCKVASFSGMKNAGLERDDHLNIE